MNTTQYTPTPADLTPEIAGAWSEMLQTLSAFAFVNVWTYTDAIATDRFMNYRLQIKPNCAVIVIDEPDYDVLALRTVHDCHAWIDSYIATHANAALPYSQRTSHARVSDCVISVKHD